MKNNKKLNEGIRVAKEGIEECWDDMEGQGMTPEQGEQMSVTISMPGKNISVTTNSAEEIGSILRLAGINVGAEPTPAVPAEMPGMGSQEEEPIVFVGAQSMADSGNEHGQESPLSDNPGIQGNSGDGDNSGALGDGDNSGEEQETDEATKTPSSWTDSQGNKQAGTQVRGSSYGNQGNDSDEDDKKSMYKQSSILDKEEEVDEAKKPDADHDGVPDWADKHEGEDDADFKESADILRLAGVTNEAQSAAQKAAFKAMIAKKSGGSNSGEENSGEEKEEEVEESTTETPATNSVFGQGVYEGAMKEEMWKAAESMSREAFVDRYPDEGYFWDSINKEDMDESARILELSGITEWANSPNGKADDKGTVSGKLPSNVGQGGGNSQFGQNRANGQGENPMSVSQTPNDRAIDVEEAFAQAMGEYRKFVSETIANKK
ncbi:hypothetical protein UFOVP71_46 [uncultured Caudovirales phage]|uniref:Uncharacterized protein n=1 Tax=uncultured Caudovirales phage TaxID=2100421 RepID=A0A6J5T991_9CAUD|nr:hypothetical protein UFOVP71_46 [uncultured Caudovirales phage]